MLQHSPQNEKKKKIGLNSLSSYFLKTNLEPKLDKLKMDNFFGKKIIVYSISFLTTDSMVFLKTPCNVIFIIT